MKSIIRISLCLPVLSIAGCFFIPADRSSRPATVPTVPEAHAECLVCKYNADLACIDVAVDEKTPRYEYGGKTYYFCSEDCRQKFARNPEKYLKN